MITQDDVLYSQLKNRGIVLLAKAYGETYAILRGLYHQTKECEPELSQQYNTQAESLKWLAEELHIETHLWTW